MLPAENCEFIFDSDLSYRESGLKELSAFCLYVWSIVIPIELRKIFYKIKQIWKNLMLV